MVKLTKIYTRGGDKGKTSLSDGSRVAKHSPRLESYGTSDEANAIIGLARLHTEGEMDAMLGRIQNDLFDLGADLATPYGKYDEEGTALRVTKEQVERLEAEIDAMNANLTPLNSFILPGGTAAAAHLHQARTVTRRAERLLTRAMEEEEGLNPVTLQYLNRLSDHLFVLGRVANNNGADDVLWVPGATR
ncbi:MAG: ATP:cob(I)alamin adenosyltransferase [Kordiimonas sp.]|nr:ATP:cob(I)alamin adenosyltransferase [Kordiimonas sp.]|tara:strand:+ start:786 stop:1355 length:570 start_codon:yes stop_codon:yes gene_type:complete